MPEFTELQRFLFFLVEGVLISFLFDFFRGIRKNFKSGNIATHVEDFIFLTIASIIFIYSIILICDGVVRFYIFLGVTLGIAIYSLTISKKCVILFKYIIKIFKSFFTFLLKFVKKLGKLFKV